MQRGLALSLILHTILFLLIVFGNLSLIRKPEDAEKIINVEILPVSSITNVKPEVKPVEKIEEKKPEPPKPPEKKEEPNLEKQEAKEEVKKKFEQLPKEERKPETKNQKKERGSKKKENDFTSVLKTVEKLKKKDEFDKIDKVLDKIPEKTIKSSSYDPTKKLSMSEIDAVKQQISKCWTIPAGARDIQNMQILIKVSLSPDGSVVDTKIVDQVKYTSGDEFYRVAVDSAVRAVLKCSPLKGLPADSYHNWKEIEINFDPKEMIY